VSAWHYYARFDVQCGKIIPNSVSAPQTMIATGLESYQHQSAFLIRANKSIWQRHAAELMLIQRGLEYIGVVLVPLSFVIMICVCSLLLSRSKALVVGWNLVACLHFNDSRPLPAPGADYFFTDCTIVFQCALELLTRLFPHVF